MLPSAALRSTLMWSCEALKWSTSKRKGILMCLWRHQVDGTLTLRGWDCVSRLHRHYIGYLRGLGFGRAGLLGAGLGNGARRVLVPAPRRLGRAFQLRVASFVDLHEARLASADVLLPQSSKYHTHGMCTRGGARRNRARGGCERAPCAWASCARRCSAAREARGRCGTIPGENLPGQTFQRCCAYRSPLSTCLPSCPPSSCPSRSPTWMRPPSSGLRSRAAFESASLSQPS